MLTPRQHELREATARYEGQLLEQKTIELGVPPELKYYDLGDVIESMCKANNQASDIIHALIAYTLSLEMRIKELEDR